MPASAEPGESTEAGTTSEPPAGPRRTITHDEFDPLGTLALISLYFLILIGLWLFTYFVEFVPNDPTPLLL